MQGTPPISAAQYAILGLLRETPSHGYELQHWFTDDAELGAVLPLEQASLYAALKDLAARGLIGGTETREGLRPPRTVYALTAEGRRLLERWMSQPVERLRQVRLDFLLKMYFARKRGGTAARALLDAQIAACHQYLANLEARAAELDPDDFAYLVVESRTSAARTASAVGSPAGSASTIMSASPVSRSSYRSVQLRASNCAGNRGRSSRARRSQNATSRSAGWVATRRATALPTGPSPWIATRQRDESPGLLPEVWNEFRPTRRL